MPMGTRPHLPEFGRANVCKYPALSGPGASTPGFRGLENMQLAQGHSCVDGVLEFQ